MTREMIAALALIAIASPVSAKSVFYAYDGPPMVQTGSGGTKVANKGIEFWTQGSPPREYIILGTIVDDRMIGDGDAIGSSKIASIAKKAGGHAVLLMGQADQNGGVFAGGSPGFTYAAPINYRNSTFTVIKYTK